MQTLARFLCLFLILTLFGLIAAPIRAQETVAPFFAVATADDTQFPTVRVGIYGDTGTGDIGDLPIQVRENDQVQTILSDTTVVAGTQLAVVLDSHNMLAAGSSGQPRQTEVAGILLDMIEQEVVVRNQDRLAAFTAGANGELQTIQDWTGEPNLIFNSTVQTDLDAAVNSDQLTALILGVLDKFQAPAPAGPARAILLFSAGNSQLDLENVVGRANEERVHFHVVELTDPATPPANEGALQELALQTNGIFVRLQGPEDLPPLWRRLAALRSQRVLTFNSGATSPGPLAVELTLPGGAPLVANANLAAAAAELPQVAASAAELTPTPITATTAEIAPTPAAASAAVTEAVTVAVTEAAATPVASATPAAAEIVPVAVAAQPQQEDPEGEAAPLAVDPTAETAGESVFVPGTSLVLPRTLLELALPILLILLAFFGFRELRERRTRRKASRGAVAAPAASSYYTVDEEPDGLQPLRPRKPSSSIVTPVEGNELQMVEPLALRPAAEEDDYDEATVVPLRFDDNEATYRLHQAVDLPLLGTLVRVTNDPNLPQQLPVYGLNPGPGEARQIHIGRHSKNNTVVIDDKSISREHAVIIQKDGRLYLRDNASTAGTYLNWRQLKPGEELLLRHSDLISFGEIVYEFRSKGEDEATVANG